MTELKTARLLLRPVTMADAEDVYDYSKHPQVGPNAGWKPHESLEETKEILKEVFLNQENVWGITLKETGKLIGTIGLVEDGKRVSESIRMIGYAIGQQFWGMGIMTEAAREVVRFGFETLGLDLITATCYPDNARSERVITKCGLAYEGTLRMAEKLYDGSVRDHKCFSMTRAMYGL